MASIRYNKRNSFTIPLGNAELLLYPGVNVGVNDELWARSIENPVVKLMLETGEIEEMIRPVEAKSDIAGIPVVDNPKMGDEPVPVMPVADRSAAKAAKDKA